MLLSLAACAGGQGEEEMTTESNTTADETTVVGDTDETTAKEEETEDIAAVYPAENATVILANEDVYGWCSTFHMNKTDSQPFYQHADIYYPVPLILEWAEVEGVEYYRVYVSLNEDMSDAESYLINANTLTLSTLYTGATYYWQIDAVKADGFIRSSVHTNMASIRAVKFVTFSL